jgi:hypothetical protein
VLVPGSMMLFIYITNSKIKLCVLDKCMEVSTTKHAAFSFIVVLFHALSAESTVRLPFTLMATPCGVQAAAPLACRARD